MIEIMFQEVSLLDRRNVQFTAEHDGEKITVQMSILVLAHLLGTDPLVLEETTFDFGSIRHEEACEETRKAISNYFERDFPANKRKCTHYRSKIKGSSAYVFTEDDLLTGGDNESILIILPLDLFREIFVVESNHPTTHVKRIYLTPRSIIFNTNSYLL